MKKLIISLAILAISFSTTFGAVATASNLGGASGQTVGTNATVVTTAIVMEQLTLYSTNVLPTIVYLYDNYYFKTNAAYTNYVTYSTNQVSTYVTTTGLTNSMTNQVIKTTANAVAASEAVGPATVTLVIPGAVSGGVGLITFNESVSFGKRVTISNSLAGTTYVMTYRSP